MANGDTKARVVAAASALFAERGFHGTTVRDIAARAGVNLAASNYHYGSKKALYLEVFRAQFAEVRALIARRGGAKAEAELDRLPRPELARLLAVRVRAMADLLIGPPPSLHGTLMLRELMDPSEALPVIVDEFIRPMVRETKEVVARLRPDLAPAVVERCVFSVVGQVLFYHYSMPATLRVLGLSGYPRGFSRMLADHVTSFSLGGIARIGGRPASRGRTAGRQRHASRV